MRRKDEMWYNRPVQRRLPLFLITLTCLTAGASSRPREVSVGQVLRGECVDEVVCTRGTVVETFPDAVDTAYAHLFLSDGNEMAEVAFRSADIDATNLVRLVGAEIRVKGPCRSNMSGWRRLSAPFITAKPDIEIVKPAPGDPFDAKTVTSLRQLPAHRILQHCRCAADGVVRAVWQQSHLLVETRDGLRVRVNLARRQEAPRCGDLVRIVGFTDTDTASLFLTSAIWRPAAMDPIPDEPLTVLTENGFRNNHLCSQLDGKPVCVDAVVRSALGPVDAPNRLFATVGNIPLQIDAGDNPDIFQDLPIDSTIRVSGIFLVETEAWTRRTPFPRISGFVIILRTPDDLRVLTTPPWWTILRMLTLLGLFAVLLVSVLVWNVSLNRRAHRKGRELAAEQLAHVTSELKVSERTRLAIELHDMLSQMLSGISMQIGTVRKFFDSNRDKALDHLGIADKTLLACRESLRDCLWDLRNHTIEEPDMSKAIRDTLEPHADGISLAIRFAVPRDRLSDTAAHAILSIVRELVVNAIRHGAAKSIKVAGSVENGKVLFSVTDNGSGFDPETAPGMAQGHFGLQGIRERVEGFGGDMAVASKIGRGTKVTIALNLPQNNSPDE